MFPLVGMRFVVVSSLRAIGCESRGVSLDFSRSTFPETSVTLTETPCPSSVSQGTSVYEIKPTVVLPLRIREPSQPTG